MKTEDEKKIIRMIACGNEANETLKKENPNVLQIELQSAIYFLNQRFNTNCNQINRANWDQAIREFADLCQNENNLEKLKNWVLGK